MGRKYKVISQNFRDFWKNPLVAITTWPRLQAWWLVVTGVLLAIDLVGLFIPDTLGWRIHAFVLFVMFCIVMFCHIRVIYGERDNAIGKKETSIEVLGFLKKDVVQLQNRIIGGGDSTWARAGEDLRIAMAHGVFESGRYAALWSCIQVAENAPTTGQDRALGHAVFLVAVSWWEQIQDMEGIPRTWDQKLEWGLKQLELAIDDRIKHLSSA